MTVDAKVRLLAARLRCPLCLEPLEAATPPFDVPQGPVDSTATSPTTAPGDAPATCPDCSTAYHAACVVELGVFCTTIGCAQGPKPPPKRGHTIGVQVRPRLGLVVPLVLTWLLYLPWPLGLIAWGWTLWRARRRRRRSAWAAAVLLSPFVAVPLWSAAAAVHGYATGTAELTRTPRPFGSGSGAVVFDPIDRDVRCPVRFGGLTLGPGLPELVNEAVLRGLAWLFGPMADAYTGPLPTQAEAAELLARAAPTTIGQAAPALRAPAGFSAAHAGRLRLTLDGEPLDLAVPYQLFWEAGIDPRATSGPCVIRAVRLDPGGLLVSVSVEADGPRSPSPPSPRALLFDLTRKRAVCALWLVPILPVGW